MLPLVFRNFVTQYTAFHAPLTSSTTPSKGSGSATFARNLIGTYVDPSDSLLKNAAIDVARFEGDGYKVEPSRQNLLTYSNDFDDASWLTSGDITGSLYNDTTGPDGVATSASTLKDNDATANCTWYKAISATVDVEYVLSVYVKKDVSATKFPGIMIQDGVGEYTAISMDVRDGTWVVREDGATWNNPQSARSEAVGDFWRYSISFIALATATYNFRLFATINSTAPASNWDVTVTGTNIFSKAQVEAGEFPTSYIENTAAAQTRPADNLEYQVSGNMLVNDCAGTFTYTPGFSASELGTNFLFGSRTNASNFTDLVFTGTTLAFRKTIGGTTYKIGWRLSSADGVDLWLDGTKGAGDSNTANAVLDTNFGVGGDDQAPPNNPTTGHIKDFKIYSYPLDDTRMGNLTS
jgi:hypothetical protein